MLTSNRVRTVHTVRRPVENSERRTPPPSADGTGLHTPCTGPPARFARDHLVEMVGVEDGSGPSRKQYRGLPEGRKRVIEWLATTDAEASVSRTNLFAKVVIALLLDEDAARILDAQRSALLDAMRQLTRAKQNAALLDLHLDVTRHDDEELVTGLTRAHHALAARVTPHLGELGEHRSRVVRQGTQEVDAIDDAPARHPLWN